MPCGNIEPQQRRKVLKDSREKPIYNLGHRRMRGARRAEGGAPGISGGRTKETIHQILESRATESLRADWQ
jgi:hypothetical protein